MRRLPPRGAIPESTARRLTAESTAIERHPRRSEEASRRYTNARHAKWFGPVVEVLRRLVGPGGRCMLCSGSEASDVEHYRPKAVFPEAAMLWENYLWSCTICNRHKGDRFPPVTESGGLLLNPLDDDVWTHFFLDEFGLLTPRYHAGTASYDARAISSRDLLALNRDALIDSRRLRIADLRRQATAAVRDYDAGLLDQNDLSARVTQWREQPFQPDVADYFLAGPGRTEHPFGEVFARLEGPQIGTHPLRARVRRKPRPPA